MKELETRTIEKIPLTKLDQRCIASLIPLPDENQPRYSFEEVVNAVLESIANEAMSYDGIRLYCFAAQTPSQRDELSSQFEGAYTTHKDHKFTSKLGESLIGVVSHERKFIDWVIIDGPYKGLRFGYPTKDAEFRVAKVVGGYVLNHMVNLELSNITGDVEFKIPKRGKHLVQGMVIKYYLVSIIPSIQNPNYGDAYIREVTFTVDGAVVSARTVCRSEKLQYLSQELADQQYLDQIVEKGIIHQDDDSQDWDYPNLDDRR